MSYELIITEKPSSAKNVAYALADKEPKKFSEHSVPYYKLTHNGKEVVVVSAVGHLFTVSEVDKEKKWVYPVFDTKWVPIHEKSKSDTYSKNYHNLIKKLSKGVKNFTIATDYDVEGEVIGYNIVRFICNAKDANRMKFSTQTKPDLVKAYEHKAKTLNWGQAYAGETRHILDWIYGINLSRALTHSVTVAGSFKILSSGRVQGPALKLLVEKELEIKKFVPQPYWEIHYIGHTSDAVKTKIETLHKEDKIFDKKKAQKIFDTIKGKDAVVKNIDFNDFEQAPPHPFDLTTLQTEAHRALGILPKDTLSTAQNLYVSGMISYPRTSSQQYPKEIGYEKILEALSKQYDYKDLAKKLLLKKTLVPMNGKKTDPAHPAIYPTGIVHELKNNYEKKLYDLIVRRFLATFGDVAKRQTQTITLDVEKEDFLVKGTVTTFKGWHEMYGPYANFKDEELPKLAKGQKLKHVASEMPQKETSPPKRYTASSIIKELEKRGLGTKSTRAQIVENLYDRGYLDEKSITVTDLGLKTCQVLEKYAPTILDEQLTRDIEEEMESIRDDKTKPAKVISHAQKILTEVLTDFKKKEKEVGTALLEAMRETQREKSTLGQCVDCKKGELVLKRSKFGRFVACSNYPDCKVTLKIPQVGDIKKTSDACETCGSPMILIGSGRNQRKLCVNVKCSSKVHVVEPVTVTDSKGKVIHVEAPKEEPKVCPKCNEGTLILRTSVYGQFYGCSKFPKCRYILSLKKPAENKTDSGSAITGQTSQVGSSTIIKSTSVAVQSEVKSSAKKVDAKKSEVKKPADKKAETKSLTKTVKKK